MVQLCGAWVEGGRYGVERQPDHFPALGWRKSRKKPTWFPAKQNVVFLEMAQLSSSTAARLSLP